MGLTHTKLRNRLKAEKVHKMVMLRMDLKWVCREAMDDEMKTSRKRKLENVDTGSKVPLPVSIRTGSSSADVSTQEDPTPSLEPTDDNELSSPAEENVARSEFGNIVDEMIAASAEDGTLLALDPMLLPAVQLRLASLQPCLQDGITEESALQLRNIFDFSKIELLAHASAVGLSSLDAETNYNGFLTEELTS